MTDYVAMYLDWYSGEVIANAIQLIDVRDRYVVNSTTYNLINAVIDDIYEVENVFRLDVIIPSMSKGLSNINKYSALCARIVRDFNNRIRWLIDGMVEEDMSIINIFHIQTAKDNVVNLLLRFVGDFCGED